MKAIVLTKAAGIRTDPRTLVFALAIAAIIVELGGIWNEVHQIRNEQVKNALYALPDSRRKAIKGSVLEKKLRSTAKVDGSVEIEGDVHLDQPVEVEIEQ